MDEFDGYCRDEPWCVLPIGHDGQCYGRQNTGGIRDEKDRPIGLGVLEPDAIKELRRRVALAQQINEERKGDAHGNARLGVFLTEVLAAYDNLVEALAQKAEGEEQAIANYTALIDSLSAIAATSAAKRVSRTIKEG